MLVKEAVMFNGKATSVRDYHEALPPQRRAVVSKVRSVIRKHLPKGYGEIDDLPLDVIGQVIASTPVDKYIEIYEASRTRT